MGKLNDHITPEIRRFIEEQHIFFVATAPLDAQGHINVSPKGLDSFRILHEKLVAYLDVTGSGNETSAHVAENRRITLMFCAFTGSPKIVRLYGRGQTVLKENSQWDELARSFPDLAGARQIISITINHVQTSCGFGVPLYEYVGQRDALIDWAERKQASGIENYWREKNSNSIDGLQTPLGSLLGG